MGSLVAYLGRYNIDPNIISVLAISISLLAPLASYLYGAYLFIAVVFSSSFLDVLDGMLARYLDKTSKLGSFIDSFGDRVSDSMYLIGLYFLGIDAIYLYLGLISTFLISYIRSKAESIGIKMEGIGFMERGERILFIILLALLSAFLDTRIVNLIFIAYIILTTATVVQRIIFIVNNVGK